MSSIQYTSLSDYSGFTNIVLIDQTVELYIYFYNYVNTTTFPIGYDSSSTLADLNSLLTAANFPNVRRVLLVVDGVNNYNKIFVESNPFSLMPI